MEEMNFIKNVKNIMQENNLDINELFKNNIVSENTFYKYKQRFPSLKTVIKIANYLKIPIDCLLQINTDNKFSYYSYDSEVFYDNLMRFMKDKKISGRKFCNDLNFSRDNIIRWKNGTLPTISRLIEICKYLNCTIDDLIK